jgi:hypothetical protein
MRFDTLTFSRNRMTSPTQTTSWSSRSAAISGVTKARTASSLLWYFSQSSAARPELTYSMWVSICSGVMSVSFVIVCSLHGAVELFTLSARSQAP